MIDGCHVSSPDSLFMIHYLWTCSHRWMYDKSSVGSFVNLWRGYFQEDISMLRHGRSWARAPAQATGSSPAQTSAPPMLVDTSDGCKYMGQSGLAVMPYTRLYSVHLYWWKRQVSHQTWPSGSPHTSKKECRWEIFSRFETHEEGHMKSITAAISGSTNWALVQPKKKRNFKKGDHKTYLLESNIIYFICCQIQKFLSYLVTRFSEWDRNKYFKSHRLSRSDHLSVYLSGWVWTPKIYFWKFLQPKGCFRTFGATLVFDPYLSLNDWNNTS